MKPILNPRRDLKRPVFPTKIKILQALSKENLNANQVYAAVPNMEKLSARQILCHMVKDGYVFNMGAETCDKCQHHMIVYKLTALGKQLLGDYIN